MNTLTLLPRKAFEIVLSDGSKIKGQYSTWALKRFCQRQNVSLSGLYDKLMDPDMDMMFDYILSAIEYSARLEQTAFSYSDVNLSSWIDQMEGVPLENLVKIFNHSSDEDLQPEKKSEQENQQNGETSSESITAQEDQPTTSGILQ